jgi:broad specificity phosphatase PhoE
MRRVIGLLLVVAGSLAVGAPGAPAGEDDWAARDAVGATLDDLHAAASAADEERYFGHFAPEARFLGTDATERWSLEAFRAYAHPHFEKKRGWTYRASARQVRIAPGGDVAWFDESLENASLGTCRGSGVLRRIEGAWKVALYDLSIPIPNDLAVEVVRRIRAPVDVKVPDTVVYAVRHAERLRVDGEEDPPLSPAGERRAADLCRALGSVRLAAVYVSPYRRSRATVAPAARVRGLEPIPYDPVEAGALASRLLGDHAGQSVLVCAHSNTIPDLLERLGALGPAAVGEDDYDDLFVVTISPGDPARLVHLHYGR